MSGNQVVGQANIGGSGQITGEATNTPAKWHGKTFVVIGIAGAILTLPTIGLPIAFAILAKKGFDNLKARKCKPAGETNGGAVAGQGKEVEEKKLVGKKADSQNNDTIKGVIRDYTMQNANTLAKEMQQTVSDENASILTELQKIDDMSDEDIKQLIDDMLDSDKNFWASPGYQALKDLDRALPIFKIGSKRFQHKKGDDFQQFFANILKYIEQKQKRIIFVKQLLKYPGQAGYGKGLTMYSESFRSENKILFQYNQSESSMEISFNDDESMTISSTIDYCGVSYDEIGNIQNKERPCVSERITMEIEAPDNKKKSKSRYTVTKSNIICFEEKTKTTNKSESNSIVSDTNFFKRKQFLEIEYDDTRRTFTITEPGESADTMKTVQTLHFEGGEWKE